MKEIKTPQGNQALIKSYIFQMKNILFYLPA